MTASMSIERLRREGEAFMQELSLEFYESLSGLKGDAQIQRVYEKHKALFSEESLEVARELFQGSAEGSDDWRSARILLDWQVESRSGQELALLDEREIAWENETFVRLPDGREIPFQRVAIDIANSADRAERAMIETARVSLVQRELAPLKRERVQRERDITESIGIAPGYNATWELLSGISLSGLRDECAAFLRDTQSMWDDVSAEVVKRVLGMSVREATRADALALFRAREFDAFFPARDMETTIQGRPCECVLRGRPAVAARSEQFHALRVGVEPDRELQCRFCIGGALQHCGA